jgi:hypothetical protein
MKLKLINPIQFMKKLYLIFFTVTFSFCTNAQLAITEFIANPNNMDTDKEWIELYNYSDNPVNLRDWKVKAKGGTYEIDITPTDYFVAPGDYVILASSKTIFETEWLNGNQNAKVIDYDYSSFFIINTPSDLVLGYDDGFGFLETWYIKYSNDALEGYSTFIEENNSVYTEHLQIRIKRNAQDTILTPQATFSYFTGYENNGHNAATTSTNGDIGTPLTGGYMQEAALAGSCLNPYQLNCGVTFSGDNSNGENNIFNYDCATQNEYGLETFHEFTLTQASDVVISLTGLTADLDVHLLNANSCDGTGCINRNDNSITQNNLASGTYFIAVDGFGTYYSTLSGYDLLVTCTPNNTTSIREQELANDIKIFPNPSNGIINITSTKNKISHIIIRDMSGRIVLSNNSGNFNNISIDNFLNGIYFVDIITFNSKTITKKISILN